LAAARCVADEAVHVGPCLNLAVVAAGGLIDQSRGCRLIALGDQLGMEALADLAATSRTLVERRCHLLVAAVDERLA